MASFKKRLYGDAGKKNIKTTKINRRFIRKMGQSGPRAGAGGGGTKMIGLGSAPKTRSVTKQTKLIRSPSRMNRAPERDDHSLTLLLCWQHIQEISGHHGETDQCCLYCPSLFRNRITSPILMYLQSPVLSEFCCHVNWLIVSYITKFSCLIIPTLHRAFPISEVHSVYANFRELPHLKPDYSCRNIRIWPTLNQYYYNETSGVTGLSDNHHKSSALCIAYCMGFE